MCVCVYIQLPKESQWEDNRWKNVKSWVFTRSSLGVSLGHLTGVGALWGCVPRVCVGGGVCAGGGVSLWAVPSLSWCCWLVGGIGLY